MAKKSAVEKNERRRRLADKYKARRDHLRSVIRDRSGSPEERFGAVLRLAALPRDGAETRVRNRCSQTGRPRGYYRKFGISRIALRDLSGMGLVPGVIRSSW